MHVVVGVGQSLVQAGQHRHAQADIGHKMAVHHVNVQHIGPGVQDLAAFPSQVGKIRRQDGRTQLNHILPLFPL